MGCIVLFFYCIVYNPNCFARPSSSLAKGHHKGVDWWAFGVLIYEMLAGNTPFMSYGIDQMTLFKRIVQAKYTFPRSNVVNDEAQDLIKRLLVNRQANRLGCLARGDLDIREHPWFGSSINTEQLLKKEIKAPWVPKIKDPLDSQYFDSYKHIEREPQKMETKLSPSQQLLFKDF